MKYTPYAFSALSGLAYLIRPDFAMLPTLVLLLNFYSTNFMHWNEFERKDKVQLSDRILSVIKNTKDTSRYVNMATYSLVLSWIITTILQSQSVAKVLQGLLSFFYVSMFRMLTMYLLGLRAPSDTQPLVDKITEAATETVALKDDLFFSGHTALLFLPVFFIQETTFVGLVIKTVHLFGVLSVMYAMLLSKVHYPVDMVVAIPFSYFAYQLSFTPDSKLGYSAKVAFDLVLMLGAGFYLQHLQGRQKKR